MANLANFAGKHAIITGGSSGIGLALAKLMATNGANLCLVARDHEKLAKAETLLNQMKVRSNQSIETLSVDVSSPEQVFKSLNHYLGNSPHPDYLFNSAGVVHPGEFLELPLDKFKWMIDINYLGTVYATRAILPAMLKKKSGHIINISSIAGYLGTYGYTAYCGSKFAVRGFSDALRSELKPHQIKVSVVFPPDTQTPQLEYEMKFKPEITKELSGSTALSADFVARVILDKVARGKYIITPGFDATFYYFLQRLLGDLSYQLMDYMVLMASKKVSKTTLKSR
jgi:3-dehydrosphinganine reductase